MSFVPAALREQHDYLRFWTARVAGTAANQMLMVAVGWQMYDLTGSAWDLGLVGLLQFVPSLALVLLAGDVVDRHHRGRLSALCVAVQAGVALVLASAPSAGWAGRELLLGLSVLLGVVKAFQMPSQQALTALLVPAPLLPQALAFASSGTQFAIIAGPALGGFLYVGGAPVVYGASAALFGLATLQFARVRHAPPPPRERATLHTMLAGVRHVRDHPVVLGAVSLDLFAVLLGGATALLPMFAKDILHVGPWGLGLLRGAPAAGALVMSIALARRPIVRRAGPRLIGAVVVYGLATVVFALSSSLWLSLAALVVTGAADMVSVVVRQALVQLETPDAMRGRVSAVNGVFIGASNQLGEFESGATAAAFGPVASVLIGGFGSIAVALLWRRWFPALAQRDHLVRPPQAR